MLLLTALADNDGAVEFCNWDLTVEFIADRQKTSKVIRGM